MSIRAVPWLLAVIGATVPYVAIGQPLGMTVWWVLLAATWIAGRALQLGRGTRITLAVLALPVLFVAAFEGGWWLIPADLGWLAVELWSPAGAVRLES